ncbi:hypothetical protein FACS1894174_10260 [Bacteroidia bacterium]|jgi:hypothetical protein|nr:hypothetical protein FACS1894174_10260 [Bacteroidia bacterium]
MKSLFALALLLVAGQAVAAPTVLQCNERKNLIFDGVRSITIEGDKITVVDETDRGAYVAYAGKFDPAVAGGETYLLDMGCMVTIPKELLDGKVKETTVQLSTYDYPYEGVECSLLK